MAPNVERIDRIWRLVIEKATCILAILKKYERSHLTKTCNSLGESRGPYEVYEISDRAREMDPSKLDCLTRLNKLLNKKLALVMWSTWRMRRKRHWERHRSIWGNKIESLGNQEQNRTAIWEEAPGKKKQRIFSVRVTLQEGIFLTNQRICLPFEAEPVRMRRFVLLPVRTPILHAKKTVVSFVLGGLIWNFWTYFDAIL